MNIAIFGLGYVGLASAACLLKQGHTIIGVDVSERKLRMLRDKICPIEEQGVSELLEVGVDQDKLILTSDSNFAVENSSFSFVCVGTPSSQSGDHNMSFVLNVSQQIADAIDKCSKLDSSFYHEIVFRSTFRPGTSEGLHNSIFKKLQEAKPKENYNLFYNPEFLRESSAIDDFFNPPKIVIGSREPSIRSKCLDEVYGFVNCPKYYVTFKESEITKFIDNSFHALKVAYANEIGRICAAQKINTKEVFEIFLNDTKLNISKAYLKPGTAFGGSCLPKDVRALDVLADKHGLNCRLIENILDSNYAHIEYLSNYTMSQLEENSKILVAGISFKSGTDDMRESPVVYLINKFESHGHTVFIFDPEVNREKLHGQNQAFIFQKIPDFESKLISSIDNYSFDAIVETKKLHVPESISGKKRIALYEI
ncbi:MAG: nucleotide sugar dehydrogenase [Cyclobacteriaceae bacterium]